MQAGLDSLGAVELRNALGAEFGMSMPATLAFDYPTPAALIQYVMSHLTTAENVVSASTLAHHAAVDQRDNASCTLAAVACRYPTGADGKMRIFLFCCITAKHAQDFNKNCLAFLIK